MIDICSKDEFIRYKFKKNSNTDVTYSSSCANETLQVLFQSELKKVNLPNKKVQKSCFYIKSGSIQESHFHLCSYVSHLVGMENYLVLHSMNIDHRKWIPKQAKLAWDMITSEKMIRNLDVHVLCKILIHFFTYVLFSYSDIFASQFKIHVSDIYCTHIQSWPTDINA